MEVINNMNSLENSCCVCMNNFLGLNKLSKQDENQISLFSKLILSIPEIHWTVNYQICEPCTNLLSIVYNFRETCLKSETIRNQQIEQRKQDVSSQVYHVQEMKEESAVEDKYDNDDNSNNTSDEEELPDVEEIKEKRASSSRRKRTFDFDCEKCSEKFHFSTELIKHCGEVHNIPQKDVRPFGCTICKSRFGTSSNLMQHIKYHEAVRSNVCSYCGKGFITKTDLTIHEKQHLNMREYGCNTCNKGFNTHKDLRSHKLVVHTDPILWKYLCDYCNKRFPIKSNYDCHMRRHTGEKKFECDLCNRKFADKCVLQRHMRSHSNVREFQCSECDKEYKDKRVMQIHMAKQHGIGVGQIKLPSKERKYICHMCPKAYYAKNKLTRHLYTHTGEKPFFCTICDKKFNDKSYVKQHIKKAHSMKIENAL
ncbi:uncharacterized protein [Diabrotica undecimpunctata]|uniref:uncharacterized protein n=1 Tax=Diabrotica undecimpunctata TaxID=50387 RepID=UPI003B631BA2